MSIRHGCYRAFSPSRPVESGLIQTVRGVFDVFEDYRRARAPRSQSRTGSGVRVSKIPNRTCISERPKVVESKASIGDWESDSVIGLDRKSAPIAVVESKSLFTCCMRVFDHTAETVSNAIIEMPTPHMDKVKTLTFDNRPRKTKGYVSPNEIFNQRFVLLL